MKPDSGDCNDVALSILEYDQFTIQLLAGIKAHYISGINRVSFDLSLFHERPPQNYVKVGLFRQVDRMYGFSLAHSDRPFPDTYNMVKER